MTDFPLNSSLDIGSTTMTPEDLLAQPFDHLTDEQRHWLDVRPVGVNVIQWIMHRFIRLVMTAGFRLKVEGYSRLRGDRPVIFAPTHSSSLDSPSIAAALEFGCIRRTRWAAWGRHLPRWSVRRLAARYAGAIPITKTATALAVGAAILERGENLVWFPEGHRSEDGALQEFHSGIGYLLQHFDVTVVPIAVCGSFRCLPPGERWPRFRSITVAFGEPVTRDSLHGETAEDLAASLHDRVAALLHEKAV